VAAAAKTSMRIVITGHQHHHHHKHHGYNCHDHHFHQVMPKNPGEVFVKPAEQHAAMSTNQTESFATTAAAKDQPPHLHFVSEQPPPNALLCVLR
jgi:hypothetical protein